MEHKSLRKDHWLEQSQWLGNQVSSDVNDNKNKTKDLVNLKSREEILKDYWVIEWEEGEYDFLKEIDNLPLFIDILWKNFWYDEKVRIWLSKLKKYENLWKQKGLMKKVSYFWMKLSDDDYNKICYHLFREKRLRNLRRNSKITS